MPEFVISNLRIRKCKKPDKLEKKMTKELRRTAGVKKNKEIKCKIDNDKVEFKGKKDVINRGNIENTQKNRDYRIIVVVTRINKNHSKIFTMKFLDDSEFLRFYDAINAPYIPLIGAEKPQPTSVVVRQSVTSKREDSHVYNEVLHSKTVDFAPHPNPVESLSRLSTTTPVINEFSAENAQSSQRSSVRSSSLPTKVAAEGTSPIIQTSLSQREKIQTKSEMSQVEPGLLENVPLYNELSQISRDRSVSLLEGLNSVTFVSTEEIEPRKRVNSEENLCDNALDNSEYSFTFSLDESQYSLVAVPWRMEERNYSYISETKLDSVSNHPRSLSTSSLSYTSSENSSTLRTSWDSNCSTFSYSLSSSSTSSLQSIDLKSGVVSSISVADRLQECPFCRRRFMSLSE
ncbi:unnamed protein product [Hymenolepis diminuta]|uniref:DUF5734 domain-containing protein n=1 Tax=Hymenolepis diminuta TaxID=6216 RepID=A0A0R3SUD4_HYMDI|nr:unnamed protein product [Hymenolepis diminuta]